MMTRLILSDDQWERIDPLLPLWRDCQGQPPLHFLEAVLWIARTGAPWRGKWGLSLRNPESGKHRHDPGLQQRLGIHRHVPTPDAYDTG
ncbi:hypothetical protein GCM10007160_00020 [Litchfieldella qijiaojingensis]|uniref:Insertion element IS402-like domain-containing protein n=1 Tax=Litchfieldella qijiaojingensis TaxID=980347 RepID=A0ABQ2Y984_9GAMM|nr:hypothetical protein GCM10007160_00020 [Halomonas qijiaojingensis]